MFRKRKKVRKVHQGFVMTVVLIVIVMDALFGHVIPVTVVIAIAFFVTVVVSVKEDVSAVGNYAQIVDSYVQVAGKVVEVVVNVSSRVLDNVWVKSSAAASNDKYF